MSIHVLGVDGDGVAAVLFGLEADRDFAFGFAADGCKFFAVLSQADVGVVRVEHELVQVVVAVEVDDGAVDDIATVLADAEAQQAGWCWNCRAEGDAQVIFGSFNEEAFARSDVSVFAKSKFGALNHIEWLADVSVASEWVADEVEAWEVDAITSSSVDKSHVG